MPPPFFPQEVRTGGYEFWQVFARIAALLTPGTGYIVGDVVTAAGGSPLGAASQFRVGTINGSGGITAFNGVTGDPASTYLRAYDLGGLPPLGNLSGGSGSGATALYTGSDAQVRLTSTEVGAGFSASVTQFSTSFWFCANITNSAQINVFGDGGGIFVLVTISDGTAGGNYDVTVTTIFDDSEGAGRIAQLTWTGTVPTFNDGTYGAGNLNVMVSIDAALQSSQVYVNDTALSTSDAWVSAGSFDNVTGWMEFWGEETPYFTDVADIWIAERFIDWSVVANRRQFINADLSAVDITDPDGTVTIFGVGSVIPENWLHTTSIGTAADFLVNHGGGTVWETKSYPLAFTPLNNVDTIPLRLATASCVVTLPPPPGASYLYQAQVI